MSHLRSSSLSELTAHTDSIRTNVRSIRRLARKIVKECNIGASLSKTETLSHQLGRLAEDKLGDCQGENTLYQAGFGAGGEKFPPKTE